MTRTSGRRGYPRYRPPAASTGSSLFSRPHAADQRNPHGHRTLGEEELGGNGVDGVHDIGKHRQIHPVRVVRRVKERIGGYIRSGMDIEQTVPHHLGFEPPDRAVQGGGLPDSGWWAHPVGIK